MKRRTDVAAIVIHIVLWLGVVIVAVPFHLDGTIVV